MKKKLLSMLMALTLVLGLLPGVALAEKSDTDIAYAVTGGNIYFDPSTGTITDSDYNVTEAVIPEQINGVAVTKIGARAFNSKLASLTIPNSVTVIAPRAFFDCYYLTEIAIPASVVAIGEDAFDYSSLTTITVAADNTVYSSNDGVLFNKAGTTLIQCPKGKTGAYTIPTGVTTIADGAFYYCPKLSSITIPEGVTSIGEGAFAACDFTSITIPNTVTQIGASAFNFCDELTSVTLPNALTELSPHIFYDCSKLASITIPSSVTKIGMNAFALCNLASVTIPDSVAEIGAFAFSDCPSLTSVTIGKGTTDIGAGAFSGCKKLTTITVAADNAKYVGKDGLLLSKDQKTLICCPDGTAGTQYTIPSGIETIGYHAFGAEDLTTIVIPDGVTHIEDAAFLGCMGLTNITLPASVVSIGDYAFGWYSYDTPEPTVTYNGTEEQWAKIAIGPGNKHITGVDDISTPVPELYVAGTDVIKGGYWTGDGNGGLTEGTAENYTVRYEPDTNTLTLRNATISEAYCKEIRNIGSGAGFDIDLTVSGIYGCCLDSLTLYLEGENSITLPSLSKTDVKKIKYGDESINLCSCGINMGYLLFNDIQEHDGENHLTVTGTGTCTISGGTVDNTGNVDNIWSYGISARKLTMESGTLNVTAAPLKWTSADSGEKGTGNAKSKGVLADITMNGGTLKATGGAITDTYGNYVASCGVYEGVEVNGGTLEATGGDISTLYGGDSYGLYKLSGELKLQSGTLKAIGGTVSYGGTSLAGPSESLDSIGILNGYITINDYYTFDVVEGTIIISGKTSAIYLEDHYTVNPPTSAYWWRTSDSGSYTSGALGIFDKYLELTTTNPNPGTGTGTGSGTGTGTGSGTGTGTGGGGGGGGTVSTPTYNVSTVTATDGTVSCSANKAKKGDTVTLTVEPKDGFVLDTITVTDKNGKVLTLTNQGDGKYTFTMPAGAVKISASFKEVEQTPDTPDTPDTPPTTNVPFSDVEQSDYFYNAVRWAVENNITTGTSAASFTPADTCTRGQIAAFLWRYAGEPEPSDGNGATDVAENDYYAKAVAWAMENGIAAGTGQGTYSPNAPCTRAQVVTFLWRLAGEPEPQNAGTFADVDATAYYAKAVTWAMEQGITMGTSANTFSPDIPCTRGQIVTFLYRADQAK